MPASHDNPIRVLIVDDHPVVCSGLTNMLNAHTELEVVGSAASGVEALSLAESELPDIMLLDLRMPGMDGIAVLNTLQARKQKPRTLVLTSYAKEEDVYRAIRAGAQGYLIKDTSEAEMIVAIQTVHNGGRYIPQHVAALLADRMMRSELSPREFEILQLLSDGYTNKQVGHSLGISENTVRHHVNSILEKLQVSDRTEAVSVAYRLGMLPGSD